MGRPARESGDCFSFLATLARVWPCQFRWSVQQKIFSHAFVPSPLADIPVLEW